METFCGDELIFSQKNLPQCHYVHHKSHMVRWDSSVGIAMGYWLRPGFDFRQGKEIFLYATASPMYIGGSFLGGRAAEV
jgi:hypothetical protein